MRHDHRPIATHAYNDAPYDRSIRNVYGISTGDASERNASIQDFGSQLLTRNIQSENVCNSARPGDDAVLCIGIPVTNPHHMVLSYGDALDVASATPKRSPSGSGGLPHPRSVVEAMSMIAYARQQGVRDRTRLSRLPRLHFHCSSHVVAAGRINVGTCALSASSRHSSNGVRMDRSSLTLILTLSNEAYVSPMISAFPMTKDS